MRILNVAEKPAMAKSISSMLSSGRANRRQGLNKYCAVYDFDYSYEDMPCRMSMTSVLGHLTSMDFPEQYKNWYQIDPIALFDAPINKEMIGHVVSEKEAEYADILIIWTDCDREGESIGHNISKICTNVRPKINVKRARFSSVTASELHYAMKHLTNINIYQAHAVEARQEVDLRTGAAFTRFLTLRYYPKLASQLKDKFISYGSCQFPTLGFVVEQYLKRENFIPEDFWYVSLTVFKENQSVEFSWKRNHLFDPYVTLILYERMMSTQKASITVVNTKPTTRWRPYPLTTIQMQKFVSNYFKMSSHKLMTIAESLYNKGYISYPRTETDQFPKSFDFNTLIKDQINSPTWGNYANKLINESKFKYPRQGKHNDQAHPPIHPTKFGADLEGEEAKIYEFIVRRFLACCSDDAKGVETHVELNISEEVFYCYGSSPLEKNYMEIYIYDSWGAYILPNFYIGETIIPKSIKMEKGVTSPPQLLSESDLISTMDRNGIGTDATIHEHINTIIHRGYVIRRKDRRLEPSPLGIALIKGFDSIGLDLSLSKPFLRKKMEEDMKAIEEMKKSKENVLTESIRLYISAYRTVMNSLELLAKAFETISGQYQVQSFQFEHSDMSHTHPNRQPAFPIEVEHRPFENFHFQCNNDENRYQNLKVSISSRKGGVYHQEYTGRDNRDLNEGSNSTPNIQTSQQTDAVEKDGNPPLCSCGSPAVKRKVIKEGPNQGRFFYKCNTSQCRFFLWDDSSQLGFEDSYKNKLPSSRPNAQSKFTECICQCNLKAKIANCNNGPNSGREYASCVKSVHKCSYFVWTDGEPSRKPANPEPKKKRAAKRSGFPKKASKTKRNTTTEEEDE